MKTSSYSIAPAAPTSQPTTPPPGDIIRVATKGKGGRCRIKNVFADDRGYPDLTDDHDTLLHNINGGTVLWKLRHPAPPIDEVDPSFNFAFDESLHGDRLRTQLNLSHLDDALQARIYTLIKKYWSVFDNRGVWVPIKNYECVIDTGDAPPIAVRNIRYGPKELPFMRKAITASNRWGTSVRFTMSAGSSSAFWLLNLIKNMFVTSTNLSGASVSTTSL